MKISKENKDYLEKNIDGAKELIEWGEVGDLLTLIEDAIIEDEIEHEDELSKMGMRLQEIYDDIDSDNPE